MMMMTGCRERAIRAGWGWGGPPHNCNHTGAVVIIIIVIIIIIVVVIVILIITIIIIVEVPSCHQPYIIIMKFYHFNQTATFTSSYSSSSMMTATKSNYKSLVRHLLRHDSIHSYTGRWLSFCSGWAYGWCYQGKGWKRKGTFMRFVLGNTSIIFHSQINKSQQRTLSYRGILGLERAGCILFLINTNQMKSSLLIQNPNQNHQIAWSSFPLTQGREDQFC